MLQKKVTKEKGSLKSFLGFSIFSAVRAIQLVATLLRQYCLESPSLLSLKNVNLYPKKIWWRFSPCGDLGFNPTLFIR